VLGVGFISYVLQIDNLPFLEDDLNSLETKSLISATFTLYCGIYYLSGGLDAVTIIILFVLILITNLTFIISWLRLYGIELLKQLAEIEFFKKFINPEDLEKGPSNDLIKIEN
jgi:hypothetical protein